MKRKDWYPAIAFTAVCVIVALAACCLSGCSTIAGIGRDLNDIAEGARDRMAR